MPVPNYPVPFPTQYAVATWVSGHNYAVGDLVQRSLQIYVCAVAHTSNATNQPIVGAGWDAVWDTEPLGPPYLKFLDQAPVYASTVVKEFKDGGAAIGLPNLTPVYLFTLTYGGLFAAEAAQLDTHYAQAHGVFEGFVFRHPRTGVVWSDVHYLSFEVDHAKIWNNGRITTLIKRPA
jgi:hypothetical protein